MRKAKQLFFTFAFDDVGEDVTYLLERYFPETPLSELRMLNKRTILKQRQRILKLFGYRLCTPTDRHDLFLRAKLAARISSKPIYVLRELLHYLTEHRLVKPGYTLLQEEFVGKALTAEVKRLAVILQTLLSSEECVALDALLTETNDLYMITQVKRQPKDFSLGEMRRETARGESLAQLYTLARRIVPQLDISREGITYYSSLVSYYSVFRLKQLDTWTIYLYLLCFVVHRYQRFNDNLLTCFLHLVKQYSDEAKATAKRTVYEYRGARNQDLPKAGEVLKLFTAEYEGSTPFCTVQEQAFALLDRQRLTRVAEYIISEASCDEIAFEWEHIDSLARRFKQHLRPLFRAIDLSASPRQCAHPGSHPLSQGRMRKKTAHSVRSSRGIFPPTSFPSERNATSTRKMKPTRNTLSPTVMNFWSIVWCAIDLKQAISFAATVSTSAVSRMI